MWYRLAVGGYQNQVRPQGFERGFEGTQSAVDFGDNFMTSAKC